MAMPQRTHPARADGCVLIQLIGGPPHLDTFDPKPEAPAEYRGPFGAIRTRLPGVFVSELLPRLAERLDRVALVRSVYHDAPPVHECGLQLLNTGRLFRDGPAWPSLGWVWAWQQRRSGDAGAAPVVWPHLHVDTGIAVDKGYGPGFLLPEMSSAEQWASDVAVSSGVAEAADDPRYGSTPLGRACRRAVARLRHRPHSFITITMYQTVFDTLSWDCHGDGGALRTRVRDLAGGIAAAFDQAFAAFLDELHACGLLERTLVVACGEFGRTPRLNPHGGRDHWAGVWTALVAGGGVRGGQVLGRSDPRGIEPADRPVHLQELAATVLYALGVPTDAVLAGPQGAVPAYPAAPLRELF